MRPRFPRSALDPTVATRLLPTSVRAPSRRLGSAASRRIHAWHAPPRVARPRPRRPGARPLSAPAADGSSRREQWKATGREAVKWTAVFWLAVGSFHTLRFGLEQLDAEARRPTPPDWSALSCFFLRQARDAEDPERQENGVADWATAGNAYAKLLARLEDPAVDGAGLAPPLPPPAPPSEDETKGAGANEAAGEDLYVAGVGKVGLDVRAQPEPWRRGYHEALLGAARAAEHLDGWVRDPARNVLFPPEMVLSPSNPRPRPLAPGDGPSPRAEACEPAFKSPHHYYLKALTARGFTSRQRLDAALAYADWLRFQRAPEAAADVLAWARDIAAAGAAPRPSPFADASGVLRPGAEGVSTNALLVAAALATHRAHTGDFAAALPGFVSVLRARQALPAPAPAKADAYVREPSMGRKALDATWALLAPEFPPPPPTGDEPATRTPASVCSEAGTMAHLGELLFASAPLPPAADRARRPSWWSPARWGLWAAGDQPPADDEPLPVHTQGLAWTRDAVDLAAATLVGVTMATAQRAQAAQAARDGADGGDRALRPGGQTGGAMMEAPAPTLTARPGEEEARARCAECLVAGLCTWTAMVERLADWEVERARARLEGQAGGEVSRFAIGEGEGGEKKIGRWQAEVSRVAQWEREIRRRLREQGLKKYLE